MILPQRVLNRAFSKYFCFAFISQRHRYRIDLVREAALPAPVLALTQSLIQAANLTAEKDSDFSTAVKMYELWSNIT